jgi:cobalamin biosynthesis Co2+ chelatase CbiK
MIHPIKSPRRDFTAVGWDEATFMTTRHGHGRSHGVLLPFACVDDLIDSPDGATTLRVAVLSKLPDLSSLIGEIHYHFSSLPRATTTTR